MIRSRVMQRGISFIGLLFTAGVLTCTGIVLTRVIPTLVEYETIIKAVNKAAEGATVPEVRAIFNQAQAIDDFQFISGKDLNIVQEGEKMIVSFAYERQIHLFGPAYLLLKYQGRSQ